MSFKVGGRVTLSDATVLTYMLSEKPSNIPFHKLDRVGQVGVVKKVYKCGLYEVEWPDAWTGFYEADELTHAEEQHVQVG